MSLSMLMGYRLHIEFVRILARAGPWGGGFWVRVLRGPPPAGPAPAFGRRREAVRGHAGEPCGPPRENVAKYARFPRETHGKMTS